eukprot:m.351473 g.351473  ORF g.351473 m.351473 type:complete len:273 (+) comp16256_c0_seq1:530-1348(+)
MATQPKRKEMRMCGLIHCAFEKNQKLSEMIDRPLAKTLHQRHIWRILQSIFTQSANPELLAKLPVSARMIRDAFVLAEMNLAHDARAKCSSSSQDHDTTAGEVEGAVGSKQLTCQKTKRECPLRNPPPATMPQSIDVTDTPQPPSCPEHEVLVDEQYHTDSDTDHEDDTDDRHDDEHKHSSFTSSCHSSAARSRLPRRSSCPHLHETMSESPSIPEGSRQEDGSQSEKLEQIMMSMGCDPPQRYGRERSHSHGPPTRLAIASLDQRPSIQSF